MKKALKKDWMDNLKSGIWNQGYHTLGYYDAEDKLVKHCCLGVLAEICGMADKLVDEKTDVYTYNFDGRPCITDLDGVLHKVGLTMNDQIELTYMNDEDRRDFEFIASWIEENVREE